LKTVHKFPIDLSFGDVFDVECVKVVHFGPDPRGDLSVWAIVDQEDGEEMEKRTFVVHGTGHPILPASRHRASCVHGAFVWHLFERVR